MQKWAEWTKKYLRFFEEEGMHKLPEDLQTEYERGTFSQAMGKANAWSRRNVGQGNQQRGDDRSRSPRAAPANLAEDDAAAGDKASDGGGAEEKDEPEEENPNYVRARVHGPFLKPEDEEQDDSIRLMEIGDEEDIQTPEHEESRNNFIATTGIHVPAATDRLDVDSRARRKLLQKYLLAIHSHPTKWMAFPTLVEYYEAVEEKKFWKVSRSTIRVQK